MAESDETKAAVEYWDKVAARAKRRADAETAERNRDQTAERDARERTAEISLER
jgi:hypothetical protein